MKAQLKFIKTSYLEHVASGLLKKVKLHKKKPQESEKRITRGFTYGCRMTLLVR